MSVARDELFSIPKEYSKNVKKTNTYSKILEDCCNKTFNMYLTLKKYEYIFETYLRIGFSRPRAQFKINIRKRSIT